MSEFDSVANTWDNNPVHWERSKAIAQDMVSAIPISKHMLALEYGAGTGILSFLLNHMFREITLMDSSAEMVNVMNEKVKASGFNHLKPQQFDLEHDDFAGKTFDIIYSQMVFHHVAQIELLIAKLYKLLNHGGYFALADLYTEDGTFHGDDFTGHNGFDPDALGSILSKHGFHDISHKQSFVIKKDRDNGIINEYPVFLLTAQK